MERIEWHNEKRKLSDIIPASYNPRRLTKEQYEQLRASIEKFNLAEIPAINLDGTLLAGHQRLKVLKDIFGANHMIDVRVPNRMLNEDECKEYNIRSNKNTGEWDFEVLANNFDNDMLLSIGFSEIELGMDTFNMPLQEDMEHGAKESKPCPNCGFVKE